MGKGTYGNQVGRPSKKAKKKGKKKRRKKGKVIAYSKTKDTATCFTANYKKILKSKANA